MCTLSYKFKPLKSNKSLYRFFMGCSVMKRVLAENGQSEDDPATDDGEDLRDGDSDSNSNNDSDKDDG